MEVAIAKGTVYEALRAGGMSRRAFLQACAAIGAALALPPGSGRAIAQALTRTPRPSVIWLSFQECTGCTESLSRAHAPTLESLIFDMISLDYHHTLQAAAGAAAEEARREAMAANHDHYLLIVDGSLPVGQPAYSTIAGISNLAMLQEAAAGAAAVIAVGSCAAFGGLPGAAPNPTGAVPISAVVRNRPLVTLPGCPPIGAVIAGTLAHFLTFGRLPECDPLGRPRVFYGETIHDRCYRRPFYDRGLFADTFDDEGARQGWCLYKLGCKGPTTYNACATLKWNGGVSFPIQSGHGCLGCSQPDFWDGGGFYRAAALPFGPLTGTAGIAAAAGLATGTAMAVANRKKRAAAKRAHQPITVADLEKSPGAQP